MSPSASQEKDEAGHPEVARDVSVPVKGLLLNQVCKTISHSPG